MHTSIGGTRARVLVSNAFGTAPLPLGAAHIAVRDKGSAVVVSSDRALTFNGSASTTIPAGAALLSDPVNLTVPPLADPAIDVYLAGDTTASTSSLTTHNGAL